MQTLTAVQQEKLEAAYRLLVEPTTTLAKFNHIKTLVKGINPKIDKSLNEAGKVLSKIHHLKNDDLVELSLETIPELTPEQKKRKKLLLLFLAHWKTLQSEVKRVKEIQQQSQGQSFANNLVISGKVIHRARGPWGLITAAAVVVVAAGSALAYLNSIAASVTIKNQGCATITPISYASISFPGLKLPSENIESGGQAVATLPPITATVTDQNGNMLIKSLGITLNFNLPNPRIGLTFDDQSLRNKTSRIKLENSSRHELTIRCQ